MSYKRVVKKKGKTYGPYIYESYRDENGKVKKRYLGKLEEKKISKAFVFLIGFIGLLFLLSAGYTTDYFLNDGKIVGTLLQVPSEEGKVVDGTWVGMTGLVAKEGGSNNGGGDGSGGGDSDSGSGFVSDSGSLDVSSSSSWSPGNSGNAGGRNKGNGQGGGNVTEDDGVEDEGNNGKGKGKGKNDGQSNNEQRRNSGGSSSNRDKPKKKDLVVLNETVLNETVLNRTVVNGSVEVLGNVTTLQYRAVINRPVKWLKKVKVNKGEKDLKIEIHKDAENISVLTDEEIVEAEAEIDNYEDVVWDAERKEIVSGLMTGDVALEISEAEGLLTKVWNWISGFTISGNVVFEEELDAEGSIVETLNSTIVDVGDIVNATDAVEVAVEYYTEAPLANESLIDGGKRVVVSAPDELNYVDVLAYTLLENFSVGVNTSGHENLSRGDSRLKVYHLVPVELNESEGGVLELGDGKEKKEKREKKEKKEKKGGELNESVEGSNLSLVISGDVVAGEVESGTRIEEDYADLRGFENESVGEGSEPVASDESVGEGGELGASDESVVGVERVEVEFVAYDLDGDGFVDYVEWVVPHLSVQVYEVVISNVTTFSPDAGVRVDGNYSHLVVSSIAPYDSLVGYWAFDGDLENVETTTHWDWTGNDNDGVGVGNAVVTSGGLYDNYLELDGAGDYVGTSSNIGISGSQNRTISAWIKTSVADEMIIVEWGANSASDLFSFRVVENPTSMIYVACHTCNRGVDFEYHDGAWHHVVAVLDGTASEDIVFYVDGSLSDSEAFENNQSITTTNSVLYIGEDVIAGDSNEFNGQIDEVMIFNTALNSTQVADIYNNASARFVGSGKQEVKQFNVTAGEDSVNVSLENYERDLGSNISVRVGYWDVTQTVDGSAYKDYDLGEHWAEFDGDGDYVVADAVTSSLDSSDFSISAWFKWVSSPSDYPNIFSLGTSSGDNRLLVVLHEADNGHFRIYDGSAHEGTNDYRDGVWHHAVVTYDDTTEKMIGYIDGAVDIAEFSSSVAPVASDLFSIGQEWDTGGPVASDFWNGSVDEVMIWNKSLSQTEITSLYDMGRDMDYYDDDSLVSWWGFDKDFSDKKGGNDGSATGAYINSSNNIANGLVGYWHFDNLSSVGENDTLVYDWSGEGNNGSVVGGSDEDSGFGGSGSGVYDGGWMFDGDGDWVDVGTSPLQEVSATEVSVSAWVYVNPSDFDGTFITVVDSATGAVASGGMFIVLDDRGGNSPTSGVFASVGTTAGGATRYGVISSNSAISSTEWYHIVTTWDSSNKQLLYINGVDDTNVHAVINEGTGDFAPKNVNMYIGALNDGNNEFNGTIDEVMIFNRSLSADEIQELYVRGRALWNFTDYQNITGNGTDTGSENTFSISTLATNILPSLKLLVGTSSFYSPLVIATVEAPMVMEVFDGTAPAVVVVIPTNGTYHTGLIEFNITATDTIGLDTCWYSLDAGVSNVSMTNLTVSMFNATNSSIADGTWTAQFYCNDSHGNLNDSVSVVFIMDSAYPLITIDRPVNGTNWSVSVEVNASVSDGAGDTFGFLDYGLVSWWRMDDLNSTGGVVDYMGLNNGTAVDHASQTDAGKFGKGFEFDGEVDRIIIIPSSSLTSNFSEMTINLWFRSTDLSHHARFFEFMSSTSAKQQFGVTSTGLIFVHTYIDGVGHANDIFSGGAEIAEDTWYMLTYVYNGTNWNLYKNTEFLTAGATYSGTVTTDWVDPALWIGSRGGAQGLEGQIDEFMIFNRSLSDSEILALYNSSANRVLATIDSSDLAEGVNTFDVYGVDLAGNVNSSEFSVNFDGVVPTLSVASPVNGSNYNSSSVLINLSSSEEGSGFIVPNLDGSLVSWWRMDDLNSSGGVVDYMGRNNGTVVDGAVQTDAGKFGKGFVFDGDGDYVNVPAPTQFDSNLTMSVWFKAPNDLATKGLIGKRFGSSGYYMYVYSTSLSIRAYDETPTRIDDAIAITTNWHHFVFKMNDSHYETFLDGVSHGVKVKTGFTPSTGTDFDIGSFDSSNFFNGSIDEVMIFNRTLSADEILGLYNATRVSHTETGLTEGAHEFKAYSSDLAGNIGSSEDDFFVDTVLPVVTFVSPTPEDDSSQSATAIAANVSVTESNDYYSFVDFDRDLVGWWRFDNVNGSGDPLDSSSYGNDGVAVDGAVQVDNGKFGEGFAFDGAGDYVGVGDVGVNLASSNFSISGWIKPSSFPSSDSEYQEAVGFHETIGASSDFISMGTTNDGGTYKIKVISFGETAGFGSSINLNQWYHTVLVWNGTAFGLYLDGVIDYFVVPGGSDWKGADKISIGRKLLNNGDHYDFNGSIDEVLIFNRSLDAVEIAALYNSSYVFYNNYSGLESEVTHNFTGYAVDVGGNVGSTDEYNVAIADVEVGSCGVTISTPNLVYALNQNLSASGTCITVAANNVTIDLMGYNITGDGSTGSGVYVDGYNEIKVINGSIYDFYYGIYLANNNNNNITNMTVSSNGYSGIILDSSTYNQITNNIVTNNTNSGIYLSYGSDYNVLENNNISDTKGSSSVYGIYSEGYYSNITDNIILYSGSTGGDVYGIYVYYDGNNVSNNNITMPDSLGYDIYGIYVYGSSNNLYDNRVDYSTCNTVCYGIYLYGNSNNLTEKTIGDGNSNMWYGGTSYYVAGNSNILTKTDPYTLNITYYITGSNNLIQNSKISYANWGIIVDGGDNNRFVNVSTGNSDKNSDLINNAINNTFLNVTYLPSDYGYSANEIVESGSELIRKWYYRAYVNDTEGNNVQNANVSIYNSSGNLMYNMTTDATGYTTIYNIIDYVNNGVTKTYYSNYTITAVNSTYNDKSVSYNVTANENNLAHNIEMSSINITACRNLVDANITYTLQNSINGISGTCFTVEANNVTIDFNGFSITGTNEYGYYGVYNTGYNYTTVMNGEIHDFYVTTYFANNRNNNLTNIISSSNVPSDSYGPYFTSSSNNTITNVSISSMDDQGLVLEASSNNNTIRDSNFSFNGGGVGLYQNSNDNTLTGLEINNNYNGVVLSGGSSGNIFTSINSNNNSNLGISLDSSSNNNNFINIIVNSTGPGGPAGNGISIQGSNGNNFTNFTSIGSFGDGVFIGYSASNNIFQDGNVSQSTSGGIVLLSSSNNNNFTDIVLVGNGAYAVDSQSCSQNDYVNLTISGSGSGDYYFSGSTPRQYNFSEDSLEFVTSDGGIKFLNTSLVASGSNLSDVIKITSNKAFVNTTLDVGFNTTANITLNSISVSEPVMRVDYDDDGNYDDCPVSVCTNLSYVGDVFVMNVTHFTSFAVQEENTVPNNPVVTFGSSGVENISSEDLRCNATIDDPDGDALDVSVRWFLNGSLNLTTEHLNQANASAFSAVLDSGNTTKTDNWSCGMRFYDGVLYSDWVNASSNVTIVNDVPVVTLSSPGDWTSTMNRSLEFSWNVVDADDDVMNYTFNLSEEYFVGGPGTCEDDRINNSLSSTSYIPATDLTCLYDNGYYYNWSVRAYDGEVWSDWTGVWHVNISASAMISLSNASMNFGTLAPLTVDDTADDSPNPFTINNDGNAVTNISVNSSALWDVVASSSSYYQFKVDNKSGEAGAFSWVGSIVSWFNMPITGSVVAVKELNYESGDNSAEVDVRLEVPTNEGPGAKGALVVFSSRLAE